MPIPEELINYEFTLSLYDPSDLKKCLERWNLLNNQLSKCNNQVVNTSAAIEKMHVFITEQGAAIQEREALFTKYSTVFQSCRRQELKIQQAQYDYLRQQEQQNQPTMQGRSSEEISTLPLIPIIGGGVCLALAFVHGAVAMNLVLVIIGVCLMAAGLIGAFLIHRYLVTDREGRKDSLKDSLSSLQATIQSEKNALKNVVKQQLQEAFAVEPQPHTNTASHSHHNSPTQTGTLVGTEGTEAGKSHDKTPLHKSY